MYKRQVQRGTVRYFLCCPILHTYLNTDSNHLCWKNILILLELSTDRLKKLFRIVHNCYFLKNIFGILHLLLIILISSAKVIITVKTIILRVCPAFLVPSVGVVRTQVVVRIRPRFGPIISSTALSVVFFVLVVFEEFGHCLNCFDLAASPRSNYFFVIMVWPVSYTHLDVYKRQLNKG